MCLLGRVHNAVYLGGQIPKVAKMSTLLHDIDTVEKVGKRVTTENDAPGFTREVDNLGTTL